MADADAGHGLPLCLGHGGALPQGQGLDQPQGRRPRKAAGDVVAQALAQPVDPVGPGTRVQAQLIPASLDMARGLDPLLEEPALQVEAAWVGEAVGGLEPDPQAPALPHRQGRGRVVPGEPGQAGEVDGRIPEACGLHPEQEAPGQPQLRGEGGDAPLHLQIAAGQVLGKRVTQRQAGMELGPGDTDQQGPGRRLQSPSVTRSNASRPGPGRPQGPGTTTRAWVPPAGGRPRPPGQSPGPAWSNPRPGVWSHLRCQSPWFGTGKPSTAPLQARTRAIGTSACHSPEVKRQPR